MTKVTRTITLPASVFYKNVGGVAINLPFGDLPESVLGDIIVGGALVVLNNSFNSHKGEEAQKLAQAMKRFDAWKGGNWTIVDRADAQATLMRECYHAEMMAQHDGLTAKQLDESIKATVKATLGDVNATFDNFLHALAIGLASQEGETRDAETLRAALVTKYEAAAAELAAERAKAAKALPKLDLTAIAAAIKV